MPPTITAYDTTLVQLLSESAAFGTGGKEAFLRSGLLPLKIISPGWGTSAFYSAESLREAAAEGMFPAGMKMYWDHPSISEKVERPERSLRDLAAVFEEAAHWEDNGPKGPGLYTVAKVFSQFRDAVWEMAKHIGPSIRAYGNTYFGEAEGKQGPIVESVIAAESVDFVTAPGRGGEILQLFEAARPAAHNTSTPQPTQENEVDLQEAQAMVARREQELTEAHKGAITELTTRAETAERERDTASTELRRLQEAAILREARDTVAEALRPVTNLPEITKTRLAESVSFNPPIKDGQLDKPALATALEEAVKNEVQYLAAATGSGRPFNLGGGNGGNQGDPATIRTSLEEAFRDLGLNEDEAKGAAVGRA